MPGAHAVALLLLACSVAATSGGKILLQPMCHKAHLNFFRMTAKTLRAAGHDVTILAPDFYKGTLDEDNLKSIIYPVSKEADFRRQLEVALLEVFVNDTAFFTALSPVLKTFDALAIEVMQNRLVQQQIKDAHFDLSILDAFAFNRFFYAIPYKYDIEYMSIHVMALPWLAGVSAMPSIEPAVISGYSNQMTFFQRISNLLYTFAAHFVLPRMFNTTDTSVFVPEKETKTYTNLVSHSAMHIVNSEILCFDYPRLSAPNYQYVSAISAGKPSPLPEDIENFIKGADKGVILFTMGSSSAMQLIISHMASKLMEAFGNLEQKVLIACDKKLLKDVTVPKNVLLKQWLPQNDILGNTKTRLFITHAGANGQLESVYHGVPMIGMPINGDQFFNAKRAEAKGFGEIVNPKTFTANQLQNTIRKVLDEPSYARNINKCSRIMQSTTDSQEALLFWVNHVLDFGGKHLQLPSIDMPMYQIFMLDVFVFFLVVFYVIAKVTLFFLKFIFRKLCGQKVKQD